MIDKTSLDQRDPVAARLAEIGQEFGHGFALELSRIEKALDRLGRPHDKLPPVVHIAGTNGKGSTAAFLRAIGEAAGLRTHVFTSPHLIRANERVRLAGRLAEDDRFIDALDRVAATGIVLPYFEALTAAAFCLFAETPADLVVLEVGLGGLHDATNVIAAPAACVIAPIDLDHTALLGDTIGAIAAEKAGILKAQTPVIVARQPPEAMAMIAARAESLGAPLFAAGAEWDAYEQAGRLVVQTEDRLLDLAAPALRGRHQIDNAGLAVRAALALDDPRISAEALADGVAKAEWPGRLQRLSGLTSGEAWLDGGHNPHAARALAAALEDMRRAAAKPLTLIVGMLNTKDVEGFLRPLRAQADRLIAVPIQSSSLGVAPAELAERAAALGFATQVTVDLPHALRIADNPHGRVLITGSLYLAGEALALTGRTT